MVNLPLEREDEWLAQEFFAELPRSVLRQGKEIWKRGGVTNLKISEDTEGIVAAVEAFRVVLFFDSGAEYWDGFCDCHQEFDCKHCVAAMSEVIRLIRAGEPIPVEGKNATQAAKPAKSPKGAKPGKDSGNNAEAKPTASQPQKTAKPTGFAAIMAERLGRDLIAEERDAAYQVDRIY